MILNLFGTMGSGKTLLATLLALDYLESFPNNKIYANYHLNPEIFKNFTYNSLMLFDYESLENCLLILDDIYAIKNKAFIGVIVNLSRKNNIHVIITAQYYTMVDKLIRSMSIVMYPEINREKDYMFVSFLNPNQLTGQIRQKFYVKNLSRFFTKELYDTNEKVEFQLKSDIYREILKVSTNMRMLEINCQLAFSNKSDRKEAFKVLRERFSMENEL